jgi:hypothetical protein
MWISELRTGNNMDLVQTFSGDKTVEKFAIFQVIFHQDAKFQISTKKNTFFEQKINFCEIFTGLSDLLSTIVSFWGRQNA